MSGLCIFVQYCAPGAVCGSGRPKPFGLLNQLVDMQQRRAVRLESGEPGLGESLAKNGRARPIADVRFAGPGSGGERAPWKGPPYVQRSTGPGAGGGAKAASD